MFPTEPRSTVMGPLSFIHEHNPWFKGKRQGWYPIRATMILPNGRQIQKRGAGYLYRLTSSPEKWQLSIVWGTSCHDARDTCRRMAEEKIRETFKWTVDSRHVEKPKTKKKFVLKRKRRAE